MSAPPLFDPIGRRAYDRDAVERFPWPVVAGYHDIHRWMDAGLAVHAAWQMRDVWERFIKFLVSLSVADRMAGASPDDAATRLLASRLLGGNLSMGHWVGLLELALKETPAERLRLPGLRSLLFPPRRSLIPSLLPLLVGGDETASFVAWRNRRFGHGVTGHGPNAEAVHAGEAKRWLTHLHTAFDLSRDLLGGLTLESDDPAGGPLTWGGTSPLQFYHGHAPSGGPAVHDVRVRLADGATLDLGPMLSVQRCEVCGQWSAFFFDGFDRAKRKGWFLKFIDGHLNKKPREHARLVAWGAVPRAAGADEAVQPEKQEPDLARFVNYDEEFEPPAYLAGLLVAFLTAHDRGVWLLSGPGGVGKSWVSRGLSRAEMLPAVLGRVIPLLYVSTHGPRTPSAAEVLAALRAAAEAKGSWVVPNEVDAPTPDAKLCGWLAALMRQNPAASELLVVLDGLDELPADSDVPDLLPPASMLPPRCWLIPTSRPDRRAALEAGLTRARSSGPFVETTLGPTDPAHREVLRRYAVKRLNKPLSVDDPRTLLVEWADGLIDRAGGSFLYVFHYCEALRYGVYESLESLPTPGRFYPGFFAHLRRLVGDDLFERFYARTLALIAVAGEPIGVRHLTEAGGLERLRVLAALEDLAPLLRSRRLPGDEETLYTLGHGAIEEFVRSDPGWRPRLADANRHLAEEAVRRFGDDWYAVDPFDAVEGFLLFTLLGRVPATPEEEAESWAKEMRTRLYGEEALADACLGHGTKLYEMHQANRSLVAYSMILLLRRDQVQVQHQEEWKNHLSTALNSRGCALQLLGRPGEALADYAEAIDICRALVASGNGQFANDLAMALSNRGLSLGALGRPGESLADYAEAIDICRALVASGKDQFANDLALALNNRGIALEALARPGEALADYAEAIGVYRVLVASGKGQFANDLASVLSNQAVLLEQREQWADALASYDEAIQCREECQAARTTHLLSTLLQTIRYRLMTLRDLGRWDGVAQDVVRFLNHAFPAFLVGTPSEAVRNEHDAFLQILRDVTPDDRELLYAALGDDADEIRQLIES